MNGAFLLKMHDSDNVVEIKRDKNLYRHLEYYRIYGKLKNASIRRLKSGYVLVTKHSKMWYERRGLTLVPADAESARLNSDS